MSSQDPAATAAEDGARHADGGRPSDPRPAQAQPTQGRPSQAQSSQGSLEVVEKPPEAGRSGEDVEGPPAQEPGARDATERFRMVHLLLPLGAFLAARAVGHAALLLAAYIRELPPVITIGSWDGRWYLRMSLEGYPSVIGPGDFYRGDLEQIQSTIAFFPLFPAVSRGVMELLDIGPVEAQSLVGAVVGAAATCLVWALARDVYDRAVADRAAVLFAFAPGAIVLSMLYAEGLAIALVAAALLLMRRRHWVAGGVAAALATATRPNAVVVVGVCAWMAAVAIRRRREWRALAAPLLAPLGILGYFTYLWRHTGDFFAWFDVQRRGWGERTDFGVRSTQLVFEFLRRPFDDPYATLHVASVVLAAGMLALFLLRPRPPAELTLFTLGVLGLSFASATINVRPRFVFFAFPLVIVLARWLPGRPHAVVVAVSGSVMALLGVFYFLEELYYP